MTDFEARQRAVDSGKFATLRLAVLVETLGMDSTHVDVLPMGREVVAVRGLPTAALDRILSLIEFSCSPELLAASMRHVVATRRDLDPEPPVHGSWSESS